MGWGQKSAKNTQVCSYSYTIVIEILTFNNCANDISLIHVYVAAFTKNRQSFRPEWQKILRTHFYAMTGWTKKEIDKKLAFALTGFKRVYEVCTNRANRMG